MILSDLWPTFQGHDNIQRPLTRLTVTQWFRFQWSWVTVNLGHGVIIDALGLLCAQLTRDLFAIAKFLLKTEPSKNLTSVWRDFRQKLHAIQQSNKKWIKVALLALSVQIKNVIVLSDVKVTSSAVIFAITRVVTGCAVTWWIETKIQHFMQCVEGSRAP